MSFLTFDCFGSTFNSFYWVVHSLASLLLCKMEMKGKHEQKGTQT